MDAEAEDVERADRCTKEELADRVEAAAKLLARRLFPGDIRRVLASRYHVSPKTCDCYIRKARAVLVSWSEKSLEQHKVESLAFWEEIVRSNADLADRMHAQVRIEKLLGMEAAVKIDHGGKLTIGNVIFGKQEDPDCASPADAGSGPDGEGQG